LQAWRQASRPGTGHALDRAARLARLEIDRRAGIL